MTKHRQTKILSVVIVMLGFVGRWSVAAAAGGPVPTTTYNPLTRVLAVAGSCAQSEVLVLIHVPPDNHIWGSSNPPCVGGTFAYHQTIDDPRIDGQSVAVEIVDGGYAEKARLDAAAAGNNKTLPAPMLLPLRLAPAPATDLVLPLAVPIDEPPPDDGFSLNGVLASVFHAMQGMMDGAQQFAALLVDNIKTTYLAVVHLFAQHVTVTPDGDVTLPDGPNQMTGHDTLPASATEFFVQNATIAATDRILVTPTVGTELPLSVDQKQPGQGFRVSIPKPLTRDLPFDWVIFKTYRTDGATSTVLLGADNAAPAFLAPAAPPTALETPAAPITPNDNSDASTVPTTTITTSTIIQPDAGPSPDEPAPPEPPPSDQAPSSSNPNPQTTSTETNP